jgi:hypothetical protein
MSDELVKRLRNPVAAMRPTISDGRLAADRIEALTAERDKAYARGYSDAETEISKSALGQDNTFLHSQYANAKLRIEALTVDRAEARAGWHKYEGAWMAAEGKLSDVEAERDELRDSLSILMEEYVNEVDPYRVAGFYRDPETEDCVVKARDVLNKKL